MAQVEFQSFVVVLIVSSYHGHHGDHGHSPTSHSHHWGISPIHMLFTSHSYNGSLHSGRGIQVYHKDIHQKNIISNTPLIIFFITLLKD